MSNILELANVCKDFPNSSFSLKHITLYVPQGEIVGLVGPANSGKSTLIKIILNQIPYDSGVIKINGHVEYGKSTTILDSIGFVTNESNYHSFLTPLEVGKIMHHIYSNWDDNLYLKYLNDLSIPMKNKIYDISKGAQNKMKLAIALAHSPKLVIIDAITTGIEAIYRNEILRTLKEYVTTTHNSVLLSTDLPDDIDKIADKFALLYNGRLIFETNINNLKSKLIFYNYSRSNNKLPAPEEVSIIAKYEEENYTCYLLDKNKTMLLGSVPTLKDFIHFYNRWENM